MKANCLVCEKSWNYNKLPGGLVGDCEECCNGICPSCLADAKLGRMVRGFHVGLQLLRGEEDWYAVENKVWDDDVRGRGATPEEALEKARVKEVER